MTHQSPTFLQPVPHYKAVSLILVTGVPHVDYRLTKLKQNSTGFTGSEQILGKVPESELNLTVGSNIIQPVKSVCDLGIQLDTELSMKTDVTKVASSCFYQLCRLRQIRRLVGQKVAALLGVRVHTFPAGLL